MDSSDEKYEPQPIIQIDFPKPREKSSHPKDNSLSAQVRAVKFLSFMKLTANSYGPGEIDKYSSTMTAHLASMTDDELTQLASDCEQLTSAARMAETAVAASVALRIMGKALGRRTPVTETIDDDDTFFPTERS
jgi:hypothetical protein